MPEVIAADNHPEFGWSVPARIGEQLLLDVQADADLLDFFEEILDVELEEIFAESSWKPPTLAQTIPGILRVPNGSSRQGRLTTEVEWLFAWGAPSDARSTRQRLRERVIERFCQVMEESTGSVVEAGSGDQLTLALLGIRQIPRPVRIPAAGNTLATRVVTVHQSYIHLETGELYDA